MLLARLVPPAVQRLSYRIAMLLRSVPTIIRRQGEYAVAFGFRAVVPISRKAV